MNRLPVITFLVIVCSTGMQLIGESLMAAFQWDRSLWGSFEPWRILTGHLAHWSRDHFLWDVLVFSILGFLVERGNRAHLLSVIVVTALLTDLLLRLTGRFEFYRGLSGVDVGLFAYLVIDYAANAVKRKDLGGVLLCSGGLLLLVVKILFEAAHSRTLFVDTGSSAFDIAVEAHIAGLVAAGLVLGTRLLGKTKTYGIRQGPILGILFCMTAVTSINAQGGTSCRARQEGVVFLHGLARGKGSMKPLERAFAAEGYQVLNLGYSSRSGSIEELSAQVREEIREACRDWPRIHFVTHSMGGIVLRQMQEVDPVSKIGRVVMIAPPNQGSAVVDRLGGLKPFLWINGPAGLQLGTGDDSLPVKLGAVDFELGVIAGDRSINPLLSLCLEGRNDGKVSVEASKVEGMKEHEVVHANHTFIMRRKEVVSMALRFVRDGAFFERK